MKSNNIQEYVANAVINYLKKRDKELIKLQRVVDDLLECQNIGIRSNIKYIKCHNCKCILVQGEYDYQECNDCVNPKIYCLECASDVYIGELYAQDTVKERWLCKHCINDMEENEEQVRQLIDQKKCTKEVKSIRQDVFTPFGYKPMVYVKQKYRRCVTCGHTDENKRGVCVSCFDNCHKDHILSEELEADFYCDCKVCK